MEAKQKRGKTIRTKAGESENLTRQRVDGFGVKSATFAKVLLINEMMRSQGRVVDWEARDEGGLMQSWKRCVCVVRIGKSVRAVKNSEWVDVKKGKADGQPNLANFFSSTQGTKVTSINDVCLSTLN